MSSHAFALYLNTINSLKLLYHSNSIF